MVTTACRAVHGEITSRRDDRIRRTLWLRSTAATEDPWTRHVERHSNAITSPTFGQDWTLDETGNWNGFKQDNTGSGTWNLNQSRTANPVNEITSLVNATSVAWTTPGYDAAGNMTRIPVPGTLPDGVAWNTMSLSDWENLKLADWEEMTLDNVEGVYDAWNRLVRLRVGDVTLAEYAYDARGYRIRKDSYTNGTLSEARHYYYTPSWQVVEERVGPATSPNRQFVWGLRYIDDLVLRDRDTDGNGTLDERRYCLQDGNWNTIALTNSTGTVTERFSYDAYGVPTFLTSTGMVQSASTTGWEILYAGYRRDEESTLYAVRFRYYHPKIGAWLTRDPAGYRDGTSLYEYAKSNSLLLPDPYGLGFWSFVGNVALGVAVGVAAVVVVTALAPVAIAAGTAALTAVGVSAATAATVSTATVTGGLFVAGAVGITSLGVDTVAAVKEGDFDRAGYNVGLMGGGYIATGSGLGHKLVPAMGGKPTAAPRTWNPFRLCRYEAEKVYNPYYPDGYGFFSAEFWATAPTPLSGSMTSAGMSGLQYTPQQVGDAVDTACDIVR